METVLGLLLVLLPLIFKAVEKKLQAAGKPVKNSGAGLPEEADDSVPDTFGLPGTFGLPEAADVPGEVRVQEAVVPSVSAAAGKTARKRSSGHAEQSAGKQPKKRIDPRKLVVYSEIMKPKYTEL